MALVVQWVEKLKGKLGQVAADRHYSEMIRGAGVTFALRLSSFVAVNMVHFLLARYYGAAVLGEFTLSFTLLNVILLLVMAGTDVSVLRLVSEERTRGSVSGAHRIFVQVLQMVVPLSALASLVLYLMAERVAVFFHAPDLAGWLRLVALILPFFVLSRLHSSAFRAVKKVTLALTFEIFLIRILHLSLMVVLLLWHGARPVDVMAALAVAVISSGILSVILWRVQLQKLVQGEKGTQTKKERLASMSRREILSISLPMFFTSSMVMIMDWTDTLMLGYWTDMEEVGIYSVALKLSLLTSFAMVSVNTILLPKASELYWSGDMRGLDRVYRFTAQLCFWLSAPVLIIMVLLSPMLMPLFGQGFGRGTAAAIILCVGHFILSLTGNLIGLFNMTGHQKLARNILLASSVLNILLNLALIPFLGMVGAALATTLSLACQGLLSTYWVRRIYGFRLWFAHPPTRSGAKSG